MKIQFIEDPAQETYDTIQQGLIWYKNKTVMITDSDLLGNTNRSDV